MWMDEYAEYLYKRRPHYRNIDPGDLTEQKALRKKLQCKSFKWFIENVAFDLVKKYPPVEPPDIATGRVSNYRRISTFYCLLDFEINANEVSFQVRSAVATDLCVDTDHKHENKKFGIATCEPGTDKEQVNKY